MIWQDNTGADEQTDRSTRIAFLVVCNFCAGAVLFVALFPKLAEQIWR